MDAAGRRVEEGSHAVNADCTCTSIAENGVTLPASRPSLLSQYQAAGARVLQDPRRLVDQHGEQIGCTERARERRGLACPECEMLSTAGPRSSLPERQRHVGLRGVREDVI